MSNSNQKELTEHCILKVRPPNFFPIPALEHCHLALYSSRRFKKTNNLRVGAGGSTNNDIWEQFGWPTNFPIKNPVSPQDQSKYNHLSASFINVNGHKHLGEAAKLKNRI